MRLSLVAAAAVVGSLIAPAVQAMPMSAIAVKPVEASSIVKVDYACGRGWHENHWGECRPNRWHRPPPPPPYWGHRPPPGYYYGYGPRPWHRPPPRW
jgi:hypothetical protein